MKVLPNVGMVTPKVRSWDPEISVTQEAGRVFGDTTNQQVSRKEFGLDRALPSRRACTLIALRQCLSISLGLAVLIVIVPIKYLLCFRSNRPISGQ